MTSPSTCQGCDEHAGKYFVQARWGAYTQGMHLKLTEDTVLKFVFVSGPQPKTHAATATKKEYGPGESVKIGVALYGCYPENVTEHEWRVVCEVHDAGTNATLARQERDVVLRRHEDVELVFDFGRLPPGEYTAYILIYDAETGFLAARVPIHFRVLTPLEWFIARAGGFTIIAMAVVANAYVVLKRRRRKQQRGRRPADQHQPGHALPSFTIREGVEKLGV